MSVTSASFKYRMTGVQQTIARLAQFKTKFRRKAMMRAGNEGSKIALQVMKANPPPKKKEWGTGTWKKSLGRKVVVFKSGMALWYGVGPRSKHIANPLRKFRFWRDKQGRIRKAPVKDYRPKYRPVLYTHLIEPKHHMIARSQAQSRQREIAAITQVLGDAVNDI